MGVFDFLQQAGRGAADFLATAGDRTAIGSVARAFGGQTDRNNFQQEFRRQFAELAPALEASTTPEEFKALSPKITNALEMGMAAGYDPSKLAEHFAGYARRNVGAQGIQNIIRELQPQPAQPRPEGTEGPLTEGGNFIDPRAGRPYNQLDALKMAEIEARTGVKPPANMGQLLTAPSAVMENEAQARSHETSVRKTQQELEANQAKQRAIEGLPTTSIGQTGVNYRQLGQLGGLGTVVGQQADPLDESRKGLIEAQTRAAAAAAAAHGRANQPRDRTSAEFQDYVTLLPQGQQPTLEGFQDYIDRRRGGSSQTVTEQPYSSIDREVDMAAIAQEAANLGITDPEGIRALAKKRGLVMEGSPAITGSTNPIMKLFKGTPTLTGENVGIKKEPRTTTRTRGGTQPAPQGGAPAAPRPGTVVKGYRFKGGDPSQQANWEPVR